MTDTGHTAVKVSAGKGADASNGRYIIRSNALISGLFCASLAETKIMLMSMYRAQETGDLTVSFSAKELQECISSTSNSKIYDTLLKCSVKLVEHSIMVEDPDQHRFMVFPIVTFCGYSEGVLTVTFNERIAKLIYNLKSHFTETEMDILMSFGFGETGTKQSGYAIRLYDILKTKKYMVSGRSPEVTDVYDIDELKTIIGTVDIDDSKTRAMIMKGRSAGIAIKNGVSHKYSRWSNFKSRVLDPAVREINNKTDIRVRYDLVYQGAGGRGGSVRQIRFFISDNDAYRTYSPSGKKDVADLMLEIINEPLSKNMLRKIYETAGGDLQKVRNAYSAACGQRTEIRDLGRWMVSAVRGGWANSEKPVPKPPKEAKPVGAKDGRAVSGCPSKKNPFNDFKQNSYDFDALEDELLSGWKDEFGLEQS